MKQILNRLMSQTALIGATFLLIAPCSAFGQTTTANGPATKTPAAAAPVTTSPTTGSQPIPGVIPPSTPAAPPPSEMEKIVVTGSAIPTAPDEVGPTEVEYVTSDQLKNTSPNTLFDALKRVDVSLNGSNSFGQEQNNTTGEVGEAFLNIRNFSTLVLLDGNRLTPSPLSFGFGVDVNLLPLAFIDHVEILKDGASSIYGADAVGGVINVITKKNYNGAEISNQYGFAGDKGDYFSELASIVGGSTTDTTSFFAGAEFHYNNQIYSGDRAVASLSAQEVAARGGAAPNYYSSNVPGVVSAIPGLKGRYIIAGSPFAAGAPGSNPAITTPSTIPGGLSAVPAIAQAQLATAGYIPVSSLPTFGAVGNAFLNTTQFGPYSFTPQTSEKAFANADHEFYGKQADLYSTFLYTHSQNNASLAPQPFAPFAQYATVPASNPYNPFGVAIGLTGAPGYAIKYRSIDAGNRDYSEATNYYHFLIGLKGDFGFKQAESSDYHYNLSFGYDREESNYLTRNSINSAAFQQAITPDLAADPTGLTSTLKVNGVGVPTYNPFGISTNNNGATTRAILSTLFNDGTSELYESNGSFGGTPFELPGGPVSFAVGGEYRVESLEINDDGVTQDGDAIGINPTASFNRETRTTYAGYAELNVPLVGPDMHVPGINSLIADGSARIEEIEHGANAYLNRENLVWLPFESGELSVRANFSTSFLAPTLYAEYGPGTVGSDTVSLTDGSVTQENVDELSSPNIPNTSAQNFGGGFTYSPKFAKGVTLSADYYNILQIGGSLQTGGASYAPYQPEIDSLEAAGSNSPYAKNFTFADQTTLTSAAPNQITEANFGNLNLYPSTAATTIKSAGIDVKAEYVLPWTKYGIFTVGAVGTYLINYTTQSGVFDGRYVNVAGTYTPTGGVSGENDGLIPKWQINPYFEYQWGGFTYNCDAEYIPTALDLGNGDGILGENGTDLSGNPYPIPEYFKIDMSVGYEWGKTGGMKGLPFLDDQPSAGVDSKDPKDMKGVSTLSSLESTNWFDGLSVTVGVNNITDSLPPYIPSSPEDNTDKSVYDIVGRFTYFQVSKKF